MTLRSKSRSLLLSLVLLALVLVPTLPVRAQSSSGIFKITLMVPQPNPARQEWSLVVQNNLQALGIDAQRVVEDWPTIYSRAITPNPSVLGQNYANGGFDALFLGYALGIDADPWSYYHSSQFAPTGSNYYLWNNTQNDQLTTQIKETLNTTQRLQLVQQWQNLAYDAQPSATILYTKDIFAFDNTIRNAAYVFSTYHYPYWPPIEQLSMTSGSNTGSVILAQTGPAPSEGFNPVISSSYYDESVYGAIFSSLAQRNDTTLQSMIPQLASGWNVAPDQKTWTVSLRPGIAWQDGVPFNATDVKFTFDALQDATLAGDQQSFVLGIVGGKRDVTIIDPYTVQFSLPAPYAYFIQNILTLPIIPAHILASIAYSQWRTNSFNTGQGGPGPIGTGPYKFISYDPATGTNHLTRNDNYFDFPYNGKTALQSRRAFEVQDYYVTYIPDSGAAIAALQSGSVNILDDQYDLSTQPNFLATWPSNQWVSYDGYGVQELGFNMQHPILGTGLGTPLGMADPSKAAVAAKYVRQAISYAIPRDLIIQQVLNGYGNPGITTPVIGDYATRKAVTQGFTTTLAPYTFNLTKSRELLQEAGYFPTPATPQSVWDTYGFMVTVILVASVLVVTGIYLDERRTLRAESRAPQNTHAPIGPTSSPSTGPSKSPT